MQDTKTANRRHEDISNIGSRQPLTIIERLTLPLKLFSPSRPPSTLRSFIWHFVRQHKGAFVLMIVFKVFEAAADLVMPLTIGIIASVLTAEGDRMILLQQQLPFLIAMGCFFLLVRPVIYITKTAIHDLGIMPGFTGMIRWQSHHHVLGLDVAFFNNEFAGRIANRIMQTGFSLREFCIQIVDVLLYVSFYLVGALVILLLQNPFLVIPALIWLSTYVFITVWFMPEIRRRSKLHSELRSEVTGKIVDSYTNVQTVKLFAGKGQEDHNVADAIDRMNFGWVRVMRTATRMLVVMTFANGFLLTATGGLAVWAWVTTDATIAIVATALPLVYSLTMQAGWFIWQLSGVFEHMGTIAEGSQSIAVDHGIVDVPSATKLEVTNGAIRFDKLQFNYGKALSTEKSAVFDGLSLEIQPGEKVGLVGQSGAGKSSLVNLLLRFYDLEGGRISIDDQDISQVSQDSLRRQIAMVTQDTSLLHRSIRDNILYGRPDATDAQMWQAVCQAQADEFIDDLEDHLGRKGLDAHVGERGVKLSGGQRQRIALARVILKNAPILILDEATSALDSEIEEAIQKQMLELMDGKTVIAIAHRLSTIAKLDRLIVMHQGAIVESGTHDELLAADGHYARLWALQSGGFVKA